MHGRPLLGVSRGEWTPKPRKPQTALPPTLLLDQMIASSDIASDSRPPDPLWDTYATGFI